MTDKQLMHDINKQRNRKPIAFWGLMIAIYSILYGDFIVQVESYLLAHSEPYFYKLPENVVGYIHLIAGIIKLIGVIFDYKPLKKIGIWMLSGVWSGLFILSFTFLFGTNYPNPSYIFMFFMMMAVFPGLVEGGFW